MRYVAVSALSHDGLVREHNEDSLVVGPWTLCAAVTPMPETFYFPLEHDPVLVAVADGLGGHPAGEHASSLVVTWLARAGVPADEASLREAIDVCNRTVYADATKDSARTGMATTLAGVVLDADSALAFNVGDSRVYLVENRGLRQVSVDDNPPLSPGQTHTSVLTQSIGGDPDHTRIEPHIVARELTESTRYLVCSDGLTDVVDDATIAAVLDAHDGGRAAFELWKAAIDAGGPDNITVALAEISDVSGSDERPDT
ncbi:MAG: protein serine/threonine phosphatase [Pseudonocardiales bacterium]|jgi:serine/threonine protein phosphatase PrpC|nr:protein serine/threonine phosphatase [Pseudonocardiales bacterium]